MVREVRIAPKAIKQLKKVPAEVATNLAQWVALVEAIGLQEARKVRGYNDEALKGEWQGYRSVRLNRAYRAFYELVDGERVRFVSVEEVNKHKY